MPNFTLIKSYTERGETSWKVKKKVQRVNFWHGIF